MLSTAPGHNGQRSDRLARARLRAFDQVAIPTLSPADILVQQALHLFKHLCGEHTRASWVLEFSRNVRARRNDAQFWNDVQEIAAHDPQGELALGTAMLLAKIIFGMPLPAGAAQTAVDRLPQRVRLWLESYGARVLLADSPGNKLYLILRQELRGGSEHRPTIRRLVFPSHLPPPITRGAQGERLAARLTRIRTEVHHVLWRLAFHVVEGLKYAIELSRWQRRVTETSR